MDDLLSPLLAAPSGLDAQEIAKKLCAAGNTDALAEAIHRALARAGTDGDMRARLLDLAVVVADEVSTYELAATMWLDIARGRTHSWAFEAVVRAFACVPDPEEALEVAAEIARREDLLESLGARSWLRRLVHEGVLGREAFERFEAALERPGPRTADEDLWSRMLQAAGDEADALIEELEKDGRLDAARRLVVARWEGVDLLAPDGRRFYGVLRPMIAKMPRGPARGELLFIAARVGLIADGDQPLHLALLLRVLEDAPDHEPAYELLEEIFSESPELVDDDAIERSMEGGRLDGSARRRIEDAVRRVRERG